MADLAALAEAFVAGRMGDDEALQFAAAARRLAPATPMAEVIRAASRAYFEATDPTLRHSNPARAPGLADSSVAALRRLYDDALGGRLGQAPEGEGQGVAASFAFGTAARSSPFGASEASHASFAFGTAARSSPFGASEASHPARAGGTPSEAKVSVSADEGAEELLYPVMQGLGDRWTWQRADSGATGLGRTWREVLGLGESFAMLGGCDALFVSPHAGGRTDPMGFPVRLASGYYADPGAGGPTLQTAAGVVQACRAALGDAVRHDNRCMEAASAGSNLCGRREVAHIGARVCNHYDGNGMLYLAECDCLRATEKPAEARLSEACEAAVARNKFRVKRWAWERDLTAEDCARLDVADASRTDWGLPPNPSRISDPVAQNLVARLMNRSHRSLDRFAGFPVACFYPPCADRYASYGYTDPAQVYADLGRCPDVRCSASINVNWVSGDVNITGNALEVRCDGGPCLVGGLPRCKHGGRCIPAPEAKDDKVICDCRGTGFKGPTCEVPLAEGEQDEALQTVDLAAQAAAQLAAAGAQQAIETAARTKRGIVVGVWAMIGLLGLMLLAALVRSLRGGGSGQPRRVIVAA
jgi:hypothetical protein